MRILGVFHGNHLPSSLCDPGCRLHQLSVWAWACIPKPDLGTIIIWPTEASWVYKGLANEGRRAGGPLAWPGMGKLVPGGITDPCGGGGTGSGLGIGIGELDGMTGGICAGVEGPQPCCGGCCCGGASCASVSQRKQACGLTH